MSRKQTAKTVGQSNQLRIIGGQWRGRKLHFPNVSGLRPSTDRMRETLFNWLAPLIEGARCLDLFAGSGALGLEAASRGAAKAVLVDQNPDVVRALREHVATLSAGQVDVVQADALNWLGAASQTFEVVFLDPPFTADLLGPVLTLLQTSDCLAPGARVYLETAAKADLPVLPAGWQVLRSKMAGQVLHQLLQAPE